MREDEFVLATYAGEEKGYISLALLYKDNPRHCLHMVPVYISLLSSALRISVV